MSSTLYWMFPLNNNNDLSYDLKKSIGPKFFDHDGSLGSDKIVYIDKHSFEHEFIKGLAAAGIKDAKKLLKLIDKHGTVGLSIQG